MRKIILASITAVVVIAVLAGTLIPVLDDATAQTDTFTNDGYFSMDVYETSSSDTLTIYWDHSNPRVITVNDNEVDLSGIPALQTTTIIATSEITLLRFYDSGSVITVQTYGEFSAACSTSNGYDLTISITGTTASFTSTQTGTTIDVTLTGPVYYVSDAGDYVMKKSTSSVYLNGDSEVYGLGTSIISGSGGKITKLTGTIDDGFIGAVVVPTTGYTSGDVTPTYTTDGDHIDLYSLEKCVWVVTDEDAVETTITYSYFIVPAEVTAERAVHFTDGENAILNAIPVIVIIALLLGVVAIVLRSRMD